MTAPSTTSTADLLTRLTLEEKIALLEGHESWRTRPVPRLGIRSL